MANEIKGFMKASEAREKAVSNKPVVEERERKELEGTIIILYKILADAVDHGLFSCMVNTKVIPKAQNI